MSASGTWISAKLVADACNSALDRKLNRLREKREKIIQLLMERGQWSWKKFRQIPLTYKEAEERSFDVEMLDYYIRNPMESEGYAAVSRLLSLASHAQDIHPGSVIFVSSDDHYLISISLQEVLNANNLNSDLPNSGNNPVRDG